MPEEPQTFDDEKAKEAGLGSANNEGDNADSTEEKGSNDRQSPLDRLKDKMGGDEGSGGAAKDIKNVVGAAEGNPVAIAKLLKDPKKVIIGAIIGALGNPFTWIFFLILFLCVIIAGSDATVSTGKTAGLCKKIASVVLPQTISAKRSDSTYVQALENAEKATGTSRLLIEAVDYQEYKLGTNDPGRDTSAVLKDIGNKLQEANYMRGSEGNLIKDDNGSYIKELPNITGIPTDNFAAAVALQNYHCVFIENKDLLAAEGLNGSRISQYCFKITQQECLKKAFANSWMVNPPVPSSGRDDNIGKPAKSDDMGAFLFYLYINKSTACPSSAPLGGIGVPGQRDANGIPILTNYEQWEGPWATKMYDYFGCDMASCGCSVTSAAMVLRWYGCPIDPEVARVTVNAGLAISARDVYQILAEACGMNMQKQTGAQGIRDFLIATHEPMVVNVNGTMDRVTYRGGHYVALAGFDGTNYVVYDPGQGGGDPVLVPAADFESYLTTDHSFFYKQ